jgi:hypothetical protein
MKGSKQKSASSLQDSRELLPEVRQPRSATPPLESGEDLIANPRHSQRLSACNQQQQQQQQQQHYNTANDLSQQDPSYPSQETVNEIDTEIGDMAAEVQDEVGKGNELIATMLHRPFDPNLVCPMCGKEHRIGERQKFRVHVDNCEGD